MKKTLLVALLSLASTGAFAANACTGEAGNGTTVAGAADKFVRVQFTPKCSANSLVQYTDQVTSFAVAAGSSKGKTTFIGNTAGGAVKVSGTACSASGCTTGEVSTALSSAEALASGS
jgi:hypothetical protein